MSTFYLTHFYPYNVACWIGGIQVALAIDFEKLLSPLWSMFGVLNVVYVRMQLKVHRFLPWVYMVKF
jgi:hypothetical protein